MSEIATASELDLPALLADIRKREMTDTAIAAKHGVTRYRVHVLSVKEGMPARRLGKVNRATLIESMFRMLRTQVTQLETQMTNTTEKEVGVLGKLTSTLERLIEMEAKRPERKAPSARQSKDMIEIRNKLAKRIDQLRRGG